MCWACHLITNICCNNMPLLCCRIFSVRKSVSKWMSKWILKGIALGLQGSLNCKIYTCLVKFSSSIQSGERLRCLICSSLVCTCRKAVSSVSTVVVQLLSWTTMSSDVSIFIQCRLTPQQLYITLMKQAFTVSVQSVQFCTVSCLQVWAYRLAFRSFCLIHILLLSIFFHFL